MKSTESVCNKSIVSSDGVLPESLTQPFIQPLAQPLLEPLTKAAPATSDLQSRGQQRALASSSFATEANPSFAKPRARNFDVHYKRLSESTIAKKEIEDLLDAGENPGFTREHPLPPRTRWLKMATSDPDRAGDVMLMQGIVTDNFLRNPQFLWQHATTDAEIHSLGCVRRLVTTQDALYALVEYADATISDLAERVYRMDTAGYLPANSIGFRPIEWTDNEHGGHTFTKWELVECSKVELPMNPFAIDDGAPFGQDQMESRYSRALMTTIDKAFEWLFESATR